MKLRHLHFAVSAVLCVAALSAPSALPAGRAVQTSGNQAFDTSYAVENSQACLGGGCHELDLQLMEDYAKSAMSHIMIKCNACHGTHTAAQVGAPKPNLTGYLPGVGATGYVVGKDRCLACHSGAALQSGHPAATRDCVDCHEPHRFAARR